MLLIVKRSHDNNKNYIYANINDSESLYIFCDTRVKGHVKCKKMHALCRAFVVTYHYINTFIVVKIVGIWSGTKKPFNFGFVCIIYVSGSKTV